MKQALSTMLLPPIAVAQRTLNLSLAAMRRLNSAWERLTSLRKAIVVGIAVVVVMVCSSILNHGKPEADAADNFLLTMVYTVLVLLMWGLYRFLRLLRRGWAMKAGHGKRTPRPFRWTVLRRIIILVAGALALFVFMEGVRFSEWEDQQAAQAATQVRIEKNKVRIGMTINEVLPLVHGARRSGLIYITADADGAWLFVLPDKKNTFTITPPIFG